MDPLGKGYPKKNQRGVPLANPRDDHEQTRLMEEVLSMFQEADLTRASGASDAAVDHRKEEALLKLIEAKKRAQAVCGQQVTVRENASRMDSRREVRKELPVSLPVSGGGRGSSMGGSSNSNNNNGKKQNASGPDHWKRSFAEREAVKFSRCGKQRFKITVMMHAGAVIVVFVHLPTDTVCQIAFGLSKNKKKVRIYSKELLKCILYAPPDQQKNPPLVHSSPFFFVWQGGATSPDGNGEYRFCHSLMYASLHLVKQLQEM